MKVTNISIVLSFLAALCFIISYIIHKEVMYLILGIVWIIISIEEINRIKKESRKNRK